jgi:hypothetical protein
MKHTRYLSEELPDRYSGRANEQKAAAYLKDALQAAGVPVTVHELNGYVGIPGDSSLRVLAPEKREIPSIPFVNIPSTPPPGIEAELVDVMAGGEEALERKDVRGKIILAESSYSPPRQEKIRLATARGAVGAVIAHWGLEEHRLMVRGNAKAVWGNPTQETMGQMPKIPAVGITKADLGLLRQFLSRGPVRVNLVAEAASGWKKLLLPVGRISGSGDDAEQFVILGGHYDAYGSGATDNANGNGLALEVARVLNQHRGKLNRGFWVCFWCGHETGTMAGSSWLVDNYWDTLRENCLAYFNVDSPGMKGTDRYTLYISPEMADFAAGVAREVLAEEPDVLRLPLVGDQSFFGIGIPALSARTMFSPEEVRRMANANLGWWNHAYPCHDTLDKIDPPMMLKNMRAVAATVSELCSKEVLPFRFSRVVGEMARRLEELQPDVGEMLRLGPLSEAVRELGARIEKLEAARRSLEEAEGSAGPDRRERVRNLNRILIRLSRILTPVFATVAGRNGFDPYGLTSLKTRFPGLYYAPQLLHLDPESDESHLLLTGCVRERNRIADALQEALHALE